MEFILWLLLCDQVVKRKVTPVPAFLAYYMATEIISWALSYIAVPLIVSGSHEDGLLSADVFVLAVMFGITSTVIIFFGIYLTFSQKHVSEDTWPNNADNNVAASTTIYSSRDQADADIMRSLIAVKHLTFREASVASLYAQGYSLGKVADELSITKSTAQSHIKIVYRKLSIHSKDELIECIQKYEDECK